MSRIAWIQMAGLRCLAVLSLAVAGCHSTPSQASNPAGAPRHGRVREVASERLAQDVSQTDEVPSHRVGPTSTRPAPTVEQLRLQLADPSMLPTKLRENLDRDITEIEATYGQREKELRDELAQKQQANTLTAEDRDRLQREIDLSQRNRDKQKAAKKQIYEDRLPGIMARLQVISRPKTVRLSLEDVIRRALKNNYAIQTQSYGPAIDASRVVEAEAQFDAVYYANITNNKQDRPSASQLQSTQTENFALETGIRKLLSTGTQVQVSYALSRTETNLVFSTLNPYYFNDFVVEFRQPFLQGFGLDFNRSQIELRKLDRAISLEKLRRDIRDVVYNVEQAYWRLMQARASVAIASVLLSDFEIIHHYLEQRIKVGYDVYRVQLSLTTSRIEQREAEFVQLCNNVRDAEDALKNLMSDPEFSLPGDIEIIPMDPPMIQPVSFDQYGEITEALSSRSELREAKLTIEQSELAVGVAKNQALPRFDLLFRYIVDGLGANSDRAFSQLSENDFHEYVVGLEFEWPIGNRGPEAALRRARLQQAQAIAAHRNVIEQVILEVKQAIREIQTNYDQIGPNYRAAVASKDWVDATKARQERRDPSTLQIELDSHDSLAAAREQLLRAIIEYKIALANLERQKGTLLKYNNIQIRGSDDPTVMKPYRPEMP